MIKPDRGSPPGRTARVGTWRARLASLGVVRRHFPAPARLRQIPVLFPAPSASSSDRGVWASGAYGRSSTLGRTVGRIAYSAGAWRGRAVGQIDYGRRAVGQIDYGRRAVGQSMSTVGVRLRQKKSTIGVATRGQIGNWDSLAHENTNPLSQGADA